jgi:hypothetical protein
MLVNRRMPFVLVAALALGLATVTAAGASAPRTAAPARFDAKAYKKAHGYLPLSGVANLRASKARSAAIAARWARSHPAPARIPVQPLAPTIGVNWQGTNTNTVSPPDPNGAIGPSSYIETVNQRMAIYNRSGTQLANATWTTINGHSNDSDPMVLWDPDTQRFYYNVLNVSNATMDFGFSKTSNPTTLPGGFCNYSASFGYPTSSIPDYPKLGQTKDFLLIGVNFYPSASSAESTSSDLLWITKPQGSGTITTCPAAGSFTLGKFTGLLNADGSQAFTPTPAIQTDRSHTGYVATMSDIECPPRCGTGTLLSIFTVTNSGTTPVLAGPTTITVGAYQPPPDAPQQGTSNTLDTLDGRITHAVSGVDPRFGVTALWTAHAVLGGAGSQVRWYEVNPAAGTLLQSGAATSASLYAFNAGISNDRTCTLTACAHGSSMVVGFTTSSSATHPAIQMVSKVGAGTQSGFVLVKQSTVSDTGFTCSPCRWGDYGGATPDPAASMTAANGEVWLSNQWTAGGSILTAGDRTQNWEARP